jgi:hypothetical protein
VSFETWLAFATAAAVLLVIPGPTILTAAGIWALFSRRGGTAA